MASWWEVRKDNYHQDYFKRPWIARNNRELPPIPKVSLSNPRPFRFTSTDKEYYLFASTYTKLHVSTKRVRNIPYTPRQWYWSPWINTRTPIAGISRVVKARRVGAAAMIVGLYLLIFIATTNNIIRGAVLCLSAFCTRVLAACFYNPYLDLLEYINPAVRHISYITRFLIYDAALIFDFAARFITRTKTHELVRHPHSDEMIPSSVYSWAVDHFPGDAYDTLLYVIPNNLYCVGTFWLTFLFVDIALILFYFAGFAGHVGRYYVPLYSYILVKAVTLALPFIYISPLDRLYFWFIVFVLLPVEFVLTANLCWVINFGFRWEFSERTVFHSWGRHFKYQRPTTNSDWSRDAFVWLIYPFVKGILFTFDVFCSTMPAKGPWMNDLSKTERQNRFFWEETFPELYVQRLYGPKVGTTGFASRKFPQGYKTPDMFAADARAAQQIADWRADAEKFARVGVRHHHRAMAVWRNKYNPTYWADLDASIAAGKVPARYREFALFRHFVEEPMPVEAYVAYYQAYAGVPRELRYAETTWRGTTHRFAYGVSSKNYGEFSDLEPACWQVAEFERIPKNCGNFNFNPSPRRQRRSQAAILPDLDYFNALVEQDTAVNFKYGILFILAISSLTVYSIILAGWSSNSKYAFIGALRSAAQMISYEVAISLLLLPVVLMAGSLNIAMVVYMQSITAWFLFPLFPAAILFVIAMLAETNRTPFDLPEAEAELVAGYNVDYSALPFAMFFLGEYCNMILISVLFCLLFLGGWSFMGYYGVLILVLKAIVVWFYFIHVRATLPRYRYDQLMDNGWKIFLPIAGGFFIFIIGVLIGLDALPVTTELPLQEISRFTSGHEMLESLICAESTLTESTFAPPPPT